MGTIKEFFRANKGNHLQIHNKRKLVNAVLYRNKTGCQWRLLPSDFPNYATVWSFYRGAVKNGIWEKAMDKMVQKVRVDAGRTPEPSYCLLDSQSAKTTNANENRGFDGGGGKGKRSQEAYCDRYHGESACCERLCCKYS
jgi:putative transposase